jgi:hypothetical protein
VPFAVGILTTNDAVLPFADFDGQRWRRSWPPPPLDTVAQPIPLSRIRSAWWRRSGFQSRWELVEPNGRRREVQITGTTTANLGSECSFNVALTTDLPAQSRQHIHGLAADRAGVIEPASPVTIDSAEWRAIAAVLPDMYRRYEAAAWQDAPENWRPDLLAPLPKPRLDAAFTFSNQDGEYTYFASSRHAPRRPAQLGDDYSYIAAWLWRRSSTMPFQLVTVRAAMQDPDGQGVDTFHPLGVVRLTGRLFWLGTLSSYAYNAPVVFDVSRAGVRQILVVDYPGC